MRLGLSLVARPRTISRDLSGQPTRGNPLYGEGDKAEYDLERIVDRQTRALQKDSVRDDEGNRTTWRLYCMYTRPNTTPLISSCDPIHNTHTHTHIYIIILYLTVLVY